MRITTAAFAAATSADPLGVLAGEVAPSAATMPSRVAALRPVARIRLACAG
jgi:hypothetical protein